MNKPLGHKAYGHIPHLPGSRITPADHKIHEGQRRICEDKFRDRHDHLVLQEKLDGCCVAAAKINGEITALGRKGYLADSSPLKHIVLWGNWVEKNKDRFDKLLHEGERAAGEWLALAHGTIYDLSDKEPFVLFDIMEKHKRLIYDEVFIRNRQCGFSMPQSLVSCHPISIREALEFVGEHGDYGAQDLAEGAVWRVERWNTNTVDFLAKYVRPEKIDGCYLPEISGNPPIWLWKPEVR